MKRAQAVKLDFRGHGGTAKAWIDPKNRVIPLDDLMHYEWLRANAEFVRKAYRLPGMPEFGPRDEVPARLWALKHGFSRVNFKPASGTLTVETHRDHWTPARQDAVSALVADNIDQVDMAVINVLNDDGTVHKSGARDVHGIEDVAARVMAIPLTAGPGRELIAAAVGRGVWRKS